MRDIKKTKTNFECQIQIKRKRTGKTILYALLINFIGLQSFLAFQHFIKSDLKISKTSWVVKLPIDR